MSSCIFSAVFDNVFSSPVPMTLRNTFSNFVSLDTDRVLKMFLKVVRQDLTPMYEALT